MQAVDTKLQITCYRTIKQLCFANNNDDPRIQYCMAHNGHVHIVIIIHFISFHLEVPFRTKVLADPREEVDKYKIRYGI